MRVAIVNFSMDNYKDLEEAMEKLIAESQCYLFTIVLSNLQTAGGVWAARNGAPISIVKDTTLDGLLDSADYFVIWNDGSKSMHKLIFKAMHANKHGTILGEKYRR